ncbi:protein TIFY 10b-like [Musa acuminata AAA Group]|uniref:protein TIFY 10b-like n=1 Tax=Musa acuminata AAA Group TaxID=214697 RepID=UPI0031D529BE
MADQKMGNNKGEKSNFSLTCRLLSQYLKEKNGFGGLGLEMAAAKPLDQQAKGKSRAPTTMSLLPGADVSGDDQTQNNEDENPLKSMDLFPRNSGFDSGLLPKEESGKTPEIKRQTEKGQLTIFYGGKVLVFDDFPAEKAKDLMRMASKENISSQNFSFSAPHPAAVGADCPPKPDPISPADSLAKATASDMPIARKNSLHRFLEKRKDRINTKAPYQVHGSSAATKEAKPESSQSWLNLGRQVPQAEHGSETSKQHMYQCEGKLV